MVFIFISRSCGWSGESPLTRNPISTVSRTKLLSLGFTAVTVHTVKCNGALDLKTATLNAACLRESPE